MFNQLAEMDGIDVDIFYFDPGATELMYDEGYGKDIRWDVSILHKSAKVLWNPIRSKSVVHWRQICPGVVWALFSRKYDWIWLGSYSSPASFLALICAKLAGVRVMLQTDTNILNEKRKVRGSLFRAYINLYYRLVDKFLAIGDKNRDHFLDRGCRESAIILCPYPVDIERYQNLSQGESGCAASKEIRRRLNIREDAFVFVFCGKLIERKRPMDFIRAVLEVCKTIDSPIHGLVVGSGPLEESLRSSLSKDSPITITGFVNQLEMPIYLNSGNAGVVCSDYDPHPLVCTEMAACGLPLIVSHFCGVWGRDDIVKPGENGIVYECGNVQELSKAMAILASSSIISKRMGMRSLEISETQSYRRAAEIVYKTTREDA